MSGSSEASSNTSVVAEQRRLFGYSSSGPNRISKKDKEPKAKKESTCTLEVVCLSSKNAHSPPSSVRERTYLSNIGLGDSSITFPAQEHVYSKILESFPALSKAGGFEICLFQRGGGEDVGFHVINPPHIATRLKQLAGQAKIYIRPIQRDIDPAPEEVIKETEKH